jgi:hypothetical protein
LIGGGAARKENNGIATTWVLDTKIEGELNGSTKR